MTRDEIMAVPVGPELDLLIAEKVWGHRWWTATVYEKIASAQIPPGTYRALVPSGEDFSSYATWSRGADQKLPLHPGWHCEQYSTKISKAWEVVERLCIFHDVYLSIHVRPDGVACESWIDCPHGVRGLERLVPHDVKSPTAEEAICRAALMAVEEIASWESL